MTIAVDLGRKATKPTNQQPTLHKSAEGAERFDYKWLAYSKNKMSIFSIQNGHLNGLKENLPSLSQPHYLEEPIH